MPPPNDGNEYLAFADLIKLERLNKDTFRSIALPFTPTTVDGGRGTAYGGHVYMQAAWAACQTVGEGFVLSNVSGNFILPGIPDIKFTYHVLNIRDGRSYCTRIVNVHQREGKGYMFTCTCVFKTAESGPLDVQAGVNLWDKYKVSLEGKQPSNLPECPGFDVPWYIRALDAGRPNDRFPGLDSRKADLSRYNASRHPLDRRQLIFYRALGALPTSASSDPNLHLCAHLYASDRNSLFIVANALDVGDLYSSLGSLVHSVVFHPPSPMPDLSLGEGSDPGPASQRARWFIKEDRFTRFAAGRGLFYSRVWNPEGKHVMTITQDSMVRVPAKKEQEVREAAKRWKGLEEEAEVKEVTARARTQQGKL